MLLDVAAVDVQARKEGLKSDGTVGGAMKNVAYGIQVIGAFCVGEIIGRGSIIGYDIE